MTTATQQEEIETQLEEDLDFERELILFEQRLEEASLLNVIKRQFFQQVKAIEQNRIMSSVTQESQAAGAEEMVEDLAQVSASKKRKIKKKAKQQAEQERIKQLEDLSKIEKQIEAAKDIKDLDFVPVEVL